MGLPRDKTDHGMKYGWLRNVGARVPGRDICVVCGAQLDYENNGHKCDPKVEERIEKRYQNPGQVIRGRTYVDRLYEGMAPCEDEDGLGEEPLQSLLVL